MVNTQSYYNNVQYIRKLVDYYTLDVIALEPKCHKGVYKALEDERHVLE